MDNNYAIEKILDASPNEVINQAQTLLAETPVLLQELLVSSISHVFKSTHAKENFLLFIRNNVIGLWQNLPVEEYIDLLLTAFCKNQITEPDILAGVLASFLDSSPTLSQMQTLKTKLSERLFTATVPNKKASFAEEILQMVFEGDSTGKRLGEEFLSVWAEQTGKLADVSQRTCEKLTNLIHLERPEQTNIALLRGSLAVSEKLLGKERSVSACAGAFKTNMFAFDFLLCSLQQRTVLFTESVAGVLLVFAADQLYKKVVEQHLFEHLQQEIEADFQTKALAQLGVIVPSNRARFSALMKLFEKLDLSLLPSKKLLETLFLVALGILECVAKEKLTKAALQYEQVQPLFALVIGSVCSRKEKAFVLGQLCLFLCRLSCEETGKRLFASVVVFVGKWLEPEVQTEVLHLLEPRLAALLRKTDRLGVSSAAIMVRSFRFLFAVSGNANAERLATLLRSSVHKLLYSHNAQNKELAAVILLEEKTAWVSEELPVVLETLLRQKSPQARAFEPHLLLLLNRLVVAQPRLRERFVRQEETRLLDLVTVDINAFPVSLSKISTGHGEEAEPLLALTMFLRKDCWSLVRSLANRFATQDFAKLIAKKENTALGAVAGLLVALICSSAKIDILGERKILLDRLLDVYAKVAAKTKTSLLQKQEQLVFAFVLLEDLKILLEGLFGCEALYNDQSTFEILSKLCCFAAEFGQVMAKQTGRVVVPREPSDKLVLQLLELSVGFVGREFGKLSKYLSRAQYEKHPIVRKLVEFAGALLQYKLVTSQTFADSLAHKPFLRFEKAASAYLALCLERRDFREAGSALDLVQLLVTLNSLPTLSQKSSFGHEVAKMAFGGFPICNSVVAKRLVVLLMAVSPLGTVSIDNFVTQMLVNVAKVAPLDSGFSQMEEVPFRKLPGVSAENVGALSSTMLETVGKAVEDASKHAIALCALRPPSFEKQFHFDPFLLTLADCAKGVLTPALRSNAAVLQTNGCALRVFRTANTVLKNVENSGRSEIVWSVFELLHTQTLPAVYTFLKGQQGKVSLEYRQVPNLVFALEEFARLFTRYAATVGEEIEGTFDKTVNRDFRIDMMLVRRKVATLPEDKHKDNKKKKHKNISTSSQETTEDLRGNVAFSSDTQP